ncbi:hypothetical protein [Pseudodesulfovibrio sediminis]|uniref:Uncharacterized protein n=1 Tax=Pseudodesulfovibrio sediminis TaxID=2810563 RepID=A0ABM7P3I3_9BACT|nr:hypothetical protein [Pseudodesulfovibrio sediminis]BCS87409.1 hypothetical protein PSDVSF_06510 [Pseudodesulfovibrio sediminis]
MRVSGSGSGGNSFFGGKNRSDSFRQKHRCGQKVKGILLKNLSDNMAWVEINGDKLLAQLEVYHPRGSRLTFIIKQLVPDIILKELTLGQTTGSTPLNLASAFDTARTLFENALRQELQSAKAVSPRLSQVDFFKLIASNAQLCACYLDATGCARALSTPLEQKGKGRILYQPWYAPYSRRQVTFVHQNNEKSALNTSIVEFDHTQLGLVRVEFMYGNGKVAYKIKMQHPKHSTALLRYLAAQTHLELTDQPDNLGIMKLPNFSHGGIITEMVFKA